MSCLQFGPCEQFKKNRKTHVHFQQCIHQLVGDANSSEIINCFFGKHQILKQYGCFRKICEKYSHPFVVYTNLLVAQGSVSAPPSSCAPTI